MKYDTQKFLNTQIFGPQNAKSKHFDVICVGKSTIDAFIKIAEENLVEKNHNTCYHLGDKLPVEDLFFSTGGGATNTAVAFSRLGLRTGIITALGNDHNGELIIKEIKKEKVDFLGTIKKGMSGMSIILPGERDRTILVYSGVNNELKISDIKTKNLNTKWFYFSSLAGEGLETIKKLSEYARKKGIKTALNISQYLAKEGIEKLSSLLKNIDVFVLNMEEAHLLTNKHGAEEIMREIAKHTDATMAITDGPNPIFIYNKEEGMQRKVIDSTKPKNTTGTGDAFAAGFVYGIMKELTPIRAADYGYQEAKSVLKQIGAKTGLLRRLK